MIKKFSSPKIKIWFEPIVFPGSFAVLIRAALPPADNFKFFYELIIAHYNKFFKKNELEKFTALAANSFSERKKVALNLFRATYDKCL